MNIREQFEHWFSDGGQWPATIRRSPNGAYNLLSAAAAWEAWQAAVMAEREACAIACEEIGFREHGPGREDSEAYDCADAIRMREPAMTSTPIWVRPVAVALSVQQGEQQ